MLTDDAMNGLIRMVCRAALTKEFHFEEFYMGLSRAEFANDKYQDTVEVLLNFHKKLPPKAASLNLLGVCYTKLKDYEKARETYQKAIQRFPFLVKPLFNYALCLIEFGEIEEAKSTLKKCLELEPDFLKAELKLMELNKAA